MSGIIFGLFSLAFILLTSTVYHMKEAAKDYPAAKKRLKKRARHLGLISVLSFAAAFCFLIYR